MKAKQFVEYNVNGKPTKDKPVVIKEWDEFRKTGLFLIVNQLLHVFGWSLILYCDEKNSITNVYPARVSFRGYQPAAIEEDYKKVASFLKDNAQDLFEESNS